MTRITRLLIVLAALGGNASGADSQPDDAAAPPTAVESCVLCHATPEFWRGDEQRLHISPDELRVDVHALREVRCHDCHGGDPTTLDKNKAHSKTVANKQLGLIPFRSPPLPSPDVCARCHVQESAGIAQSVHGRQTSRAAANRAPSDCLSCHGGRPHRILAVRDPKSPVFRLQQIQLCGTCHAPQQIEYERSIHGQAVRRAGLATAAVCADCHGAHRILESTDPNSTLYKTHADATCARCHRFIQQRIARSVHGPATVHSDQPVAEINRRPACTDCHVGHERALDETDHPIRGGARQCGNCHSTYADHGLSSFHTVLTKSGYRPAARCSQCHGAHEIPPLDDDSSPLAAGVNRIATCRGCHANAPSNLTSFLPHAVSPEHAAYALRPTTIRSAGSWLLWIVLSCAIAYAAVGLPRCLVEQVHARRNGTMLPGARGIRIRPRSQQVLAIVATVAFLGLATTGLALRNGQRPWLSPLVVVLGGFQSADLWHHIFGLAITVCFLAHGGWLLFQLGARIRHRSGLHDALFGIDSPLLSHRDLVDLLHTVRWFLGVGPRPACARWTFWEKLEYWLVGGAIILLGSTGFMLWFPYWTSAVLPGSVLNLAQAIHAEAGLPIVGLILALHLVTRHLSPDHFPCDMGVLTGVRSEAELRATRPDFWQRLVATGRLDQLETTVPERRRLRAFQILGYVGLLAAAMLFAAILATGLLG